MNSDFKRNHSEHQAILKIDGQKLLKMDDGGGLLSSLGGLPVATSVAQDSKLLEMASARIPEWRKPNRVDFPIPNLLEFSGRKRHPNALTHLNI